MDPQDIPPPDADVWVAAEDGKGIVYAGKAAALEWLGGDPGDEELPVTPPNVVEALGFDPKDE